MCKLDVEMQMGQCGILVDILDESVIAGGVQSRGRLGSVAEMCCDVKTRALNTDPVWIVSYQVTVGPELLKKNQNKTEKHRTIVYKALRELILFCLILRARCLGAGMEG